MGSAAALMEKAEQALNSARMLLEAGDPDGAVSRAYFGLFVMVRACLIAAGGTTGNDLGGERWPVVHALGQLIPDETLKESLGRAWSDSDDLRLMADLGARSAPADRVSDLLGRIEALFPQLGELYPPDEGESMSVLVLASDFSALGNLRRAKIGTRYEVVMPQVIWGDLPRPDSYFAGRPALTLDAEDEAAPENIHWLETSSVTWSDSKALWPGLRELIAAHDRTELWIDPDPNSQLTLMLLLDYLGDDLNRLRLYQSATRLGEHPAEHTLTSAPPIEPLDSTDAALASQVWRAYTAPTPERAFSLLDSDLTRYPFLHGAILALLQELPWVRNGLGLTQRWLLQKLAEGAETPRDIFGIPHSDWPQTYRSWESGAIFDDLSHCRLPAITGLADSPFAHELRDDPERHKRYLQSRIGLSDFGRALLDGTADFAKENKIDRQWGGTRLVNDALWRWDGERRQLKAP
jgi:uncharacterized protein (UPF0332 family)